MNIAATRPLQLTIQSTKPKIDFSINSIVGTNLNGTIKNAVCNSSDSLDRTGSPFSDLSYSSDLVLTQRSNLVKSPHEINRLASPTRTEVQNDFHNRISFSSRSMYSDVNSDENDLQIDVQNIGTIDKNDTQSERYPVVNCTKSRSPSPILPEGPGNSIRLRVINPEQPDVKYLPPYIHGPSDTVSARDGNNHQFLAAQFHMAAVLAHAQPAPPSTMYPHHAIHFQNQNVGHESYPMYPWLISRHGRIFPHRFPGSKSHLQNAFFSIHNIISQK